MTIRESYEALQERRRAMQSTLLGPMYLAQEQRYVHPFRIFGNIWYVGDSWVCVHLIDTGKGLLLLDSGNMGATAMLIQAIWEAGFNPADVRWIIHSHGHLDHIGGARFFKRMWGTQLYLGAPDARMFREKPWLSLMHEGCSDRDELFTPDHEIEDGDVLTFGNITIRFVLTPGHTDGVLSCFFDAEENGVTARCGYYGGFGFNTLQRDYLTENDIPVDQARAVYLSSLEKVRNEKVELFLGNHTDNNDTLGCRALQLARPDAPNPFINSTRWRDYLDSRKSELLALIDAEKAEVPEEKQ